MGIYYRLQSNKYNIEKGHKSYVWSRESLFDAMKEDLYRWNIISSTYDFWEDDEKDVEHITKLWENNYEEYMYMYDAHSVEAGTSCFDSMEELREYFEDHDFELSNYHYVLVFEGEYLGIGTDGETIAAYERDVEKIEWDYSFFDIFEC